MAKDIRATGKISNMEIKTHARLSKNIEASARVGQTVTIGGTTDYERLRNLPSIEGVTLIGNKTFPQLNMSKLTNSEIEALLQ